MSKLASSSTTSDQSESCAMASLKKFLWSEVQNIAVTSSEWGLSWCRSINRSICIFSAESPNCLNSSARVGLFRLIALRFIWSIPDTGFSDQADEWNSNRFSDYALAQGSSSYHLQRESNSNSLPDDGSLPSSNSYGQHLELNSNWSPEKMPMNTPISRAKGWDISPNLPRRYGVHQNALYASLTWLLAASTYPAAFDIHNH